MEEGSEETVKKIILLITEKTVETSSKSQRVKISLEASKSLSYFNHYLIFKF